MQICTVNSELRLSEEIFLDVCCHLTCWVLSLKLDLKDDGKFLNPRTNMNLNAN